MENNPLLDISRISGKRGSKSAGRFLAKIEGVKILVSMESKSF